MLPKRGQAFEPLSRPEQESSTLAAPRTSQEVLTRPAVKPGEPVEERPRAGIGGTKTQAGNQSNPLTELDNSLAQQRELNRQAGIVEPEPNYYKTVFPHDEGIPV